MSFGALGSVAGVGFRFFLPPAQLKLSRTAGTSFETTTRELDPGESTLFKQKGPEASNNHTRLKSVLSPNPRDLTAPRKAQVD